MHAVAGLFRVLDLKPAHAPDGRKGDAGLSTGLQAAKPRKKILHRRIFPQREELLPEPGFVVER